MQTPRSFRRVRAWLVSARRLTAALSLAALWAIGARCPAAAAPACAGDCDADGAISISELITAVNIAIGSITVAGCAAADTDPDGLVTVNEIIRAVNGALGGCPPPTPGPELIVAEQANLQPEGIEYDAARGRFLVGSRTRGVIQWVDDDGTLTPAVAESGLDVSLGLHIDRGSDRLLAAGAFGAANTPALGIYALGSGERLHVVDLSAVAAPGAHLANDVVSDADGNAYVTDTLTPAIYRVAPDGSATIFSDDVALSRANGIEIYDDRYLIVATLTGPVLLRVSLDDPPVVTPITAEFPGGGDGIVFMSNGDLAVVGSAGGSGVVYRLRSDDDWLSADVVGEWNTAPLGFGGPTTAARRGDDVYAVFAHLFDDARIAYEIARAQFVAPGD